MKKLKAMESEESAESSWEPLVINSPWISINILPFSVLPCLFQLEDTETKWGELGMKLQAHTDESFKIPILRGCKMQLCNGRTFRRELMCDDSGSSDTTMVLKNNKRINKRICQMEVNYAEGILFPGSGNLEGSASWDLCVCLRVNTLWENKIHAHRLVNNSQAYQAAVVRPCFDNTSPNRRGRAKYEVCEESMGRQHSSTRRLVSLIQQMTFFIWTCLPKFSTGSFPSSNKNKALTHLKPQTQDTSVTSFQLMVDTKLKIA